jgi:ribosomal protein RSM22 (predicted rRNA methylase)
VDIPEGLKDSINKLLSENKSSNIIENAQIISSRYRKNDGKGKRLLTNELEAVSYVISRMPATYAAVYSVFKQILVNYDEKITSLLDVGAGTGAGTWAVNEIENMSQITCLEREKSMSNIGKKLMKNTVLDNVQWKSYDILQDEIVEKADIVLTSYMINELPEQEREKAVLKLWQATDKLMVVIEPGTPEGFKNILNIRNLIKEQGGYIVAPCCCNGECPIKENDWCAFYARVARSSIHRQAKGGNLGYEDEKFSYIAFSKTPVEITGERILRHPQINSGFVKVKLCTADGIQEKTYSKKDGEIYKKIKKLDAGEKIY